MTETNLKMQVCNLIDASVLDKMDAFGGISDHWKIISPVDGIINITVGCSVYKINKGEIAFIPPKEFHCIKADENSNYILIAFEGQGELLKNLSGAVFDLSDREQLLIDDISDIIDKTHDSIYNQQICSIAQLLFLRCCNKEAVVTDSLKERDVDLFAKAVTILNKSIQSQISVDELALELGISLSHLKRIFARYTMLGVHEYFTYLKVERAKELLRAGETVTRTAGLSGFSNQAYFSAAFKRITNISPKEFAGNFKVSRTLKTKPTIIKTNSKDLPSYLL